MSTENNAGVEDDGYRTFDTESAFSAFAFVALWDPEEETIVFSQKESIKTSKDAHSTSQLLRPKSSISDLQSLYFPTLASSSSSASYHSDCRQILRDRHGTLFSLHAKEDERLPFHRRGMSQTSSTLGGLDVYLKDSALSLTHRNQPVYSVLDFETGFDLKSYSNTTEAGECSLGGGYFGRLSRLELNKLSMVFGNRSTTAMDDRWTAIESPSSEDLSHESSYRSPTEASRHQHSPRRLKKRRPSEARSSSSSPTTPTLQDALPAYCRSQQNSKSSLAFRDGLAQRQLFGFGKLKRKVKDNNDWILVDT